MQRGLCMICVLLLWAGLCPEGYGQLKKADSQRFVNWLVKDPGQMITGVGSEELIRFGVAGASIATLSSADEMTYSLIHTDEGNSRFLDAANRLGAKKLAFPASAGLFGISMLTDDQKFQDAAFTSLQSLIMTNLAIGGGKFLFARTRPGTRAGAYNFDFVRLNQTSFPSGHTATAFAMVTPWVVYYPNVATYSLMVVPAATGIARVYKGKHWLSDVTAGALIGFSISYYLSREHLDYGTKSLQIWPRFGSDHVGLSLSVDF